MKPDAQRITLETGNRFAKALVDGKYQEARSLLDEKLQKQYSPGNLAAQYEEMVSYGEEPAAVDGYTDFMDEWPDRQPDDIGWAYISISGDGFVEAVTVIVAKEKGLPKIRSIEWGRP